MRVNDPNLSKTNQVLPSKILVVAAIPMTRFSGVAERSHITPMREMRFMF